MTVNIAAVIFAADTERVSLFYQSITGAMRLHTDADHTVLAGGGFELTVHSLRGEPLPSVPPIVREDTAIKLCFYVPSLARARTTASLLGGSVKPTGGEWHGRGFIACDGHDPEGNVFQLREHKADG
jgi:hypothetical protein